MTFMRPRAPCRTICTLLFILSTVPAFSPLNADDRSDILKDKLPQGQKVLTLDGRFVHNIGNLQMNINNWGFVGSMPKSRHPMSESPSAQWPAGSGVEYLFAAGLWVGASFNGIPVVSTGYPETEFYPPQDPKDTIYRSFEGDKGGTRYPRKADDDDDGRVDEDWLNGYDDDNDGLIDEDFAGIGKQMFSCWYTDDQPVSSQLWPEHTPMNLFVRQESYQWGEEGYNNFIAVHYEIENTGYNFLAGVYVGIYADVDAGPVEYGSYHRDDQVGLWEGEYCAPWGDGQKPIRMTIAYVYDNDGDNGRTLGYFGIMVLGYNTHGYGPSRPPSTGIRTFKTFCSLLSFESGGEPTNDYERYEALSSGEKDPNSDAENDYKILVSVGPSTLVPGYTISFDIAYVCGNGLEEMIKNAAQAKMVYDGTWYNADKDYDTGIIGRETPVIGPLKEFDPDGCDGLEEKISIAKAETLWANLDCGEEQWMMRNHTCYKDPHIPQNAYQTGVNGAEHHIFWITQSAPPPPRFRVVPGDHQVTLFWDNLSEVVPDMLTRKFDFEGFQIWRAENWHRPLGTSILSGPSADLWYLLQARDIVNGVAPDIEFRMPVSQGGWQYDPLQKLEYREHYLRLFEESLWYSPLNTVPCPVGLSEEVCDTLEALARHNLGIDGGKQYYKFVDREAKNGLPYFYSVIAYDHVLDGDTPVRPGIFTTPASNFVYAVPLSRAQSSETYDDKEVYVVPNPATAENMDPWRMDPNNADPSGIKIEFRNLPMCYNTVRISTISGDLVEVLYHDGRGGNGTLPWNLISRNGQDVTSGVYLFSVEPQDGKFSRTVGKFVVIR